MCTGRFIRETFAPLLLVRRSESASRGKIGISSPYWIDDILRKILFSNILFIENYSIIRYCVVF